MISIDTNILVRLLTMDDKGQYDKAIQLFEQEHIYITKTVILETEWVLRYAYEFVASDIGQAFNLLLGQENVTIEDAQHISQAIGMLREGMDSADALHLACSLNHPFATFDKKLKARAMQAGIKRVRLI